MGVAVVVCISCLLNSFTSVSLGRSRQNRQACEQNTSTNSLEYVKTFEPYVPLVIRCFDSYLTVGDAW